MMSSFKSWVKRTCINAVEKAVPQRVADRLVRHYSIPDCDWSLRNARDNGFMPELIIDVGAYEGEWARMVHRIFPSARILAVEPQREKKEILQALSLSAARIDYDMALLGAEDNCEVTFHLNETVSSVLSEVVSEAPDREKRSTVTLDTLVEGTNFTSPDFIKLDVQGYELEVLRGGRNIFTLSPPEMIQMEISLIEINSGAPLLPEVIEYMNDLGYQLYDIAEFIRRPMDDALWQIDVIFVRKDSNLISSHRWI